jgi:hypothetical protein
MKKSKIIVPAMAVIAFSTAASIAGSVAWFTASRTVTISGGSYAVVKTTSNLNAVATAGVGTSVNNDNSVNFTGKLTDASFNHNTTNGRKFYIPNGLKGEAFDFEKEVELSSATLEADLTRTSITVGGTTYTVYSAATFDIEFDMDFGSGQPDAAIFLDAEQSSFRVANDAEPVTAKGFRMAFIPVTVPTGSSGLPKVYADLQSAGKCKYTSGLADKTGTVYTGHDLIDSGYNTPVPSSTVDPDDLEGFNNYLGRIASPTGGGHVKMKYTVVAWFDGNDENIVNQESAANYQTVSANLTFTAVDVVEAPVNP